MSTTDKPVTQIAEHEVNRAVDQSPQVPAFRAQGEESNNAPKMIGAKNAINIE
jgi:hypothetical protein